MGLIYTKSPHRNQGSQEYLPVFCPFLNISVGGIGLKDPLTFQICFFFFSPGKMTFKRHIWAQEKLSSDITETYLMCCLNATPDCIMLWLAFGQFCYAYREKRGEEWMEKRDQACII